MLLVVDANELFSALISRGKTLELFFSKGITLASPDFIFSEFKEHIFEISKKAGLDKEKLNSFLMIITQRIQFFSVEEFSSFLLEAKNICPDKDDIEYFALALKLRCPIWSEDKKLRNQNKVEIISTRELVGII